ncbi:MAG: DUF1640 domain-containing protein [bacterium]|nr:DUF1640 domain-containing protein [bacterium]
MSYAATFDALEFVEELQSTGVPEAQAKAHARALSKAFNTFQEEHLKELSTKGDLNLAIGDLKLEIEKVRREIAETKTEIIKWVVGLLLVQTGIIIGAVFAIVRFLITTPGP